MKKEIRLRIQLLFLFLITIQTITTACSCWPYESVFCRSVTPWHNVVSVVVTEHLEFHLMEVKIIENINEEIAEDTIVIYGQDGLTCGELLNQFEFQDTLILAVTHWEVNGNNYWYLEGTCGIHFLRQNQNA